MDNNWIWLGIGVVVGAGIAIYILKSIPSSLAQPLQPQQTVRPQPIVYQNEEVYEWVDYKGNQRKLVVHRNVKQTS